MNHEPGTEIPLVFIDIDHCHFLPFVGCGFHQQSPAGSSGVLAARTSMGFVGIRVGTLGEVE